MRILLLLLLPIFSFSQPKTLGQVHTQQLKQARLDTMAAVINITFSDVVADIGSGNGSNLIKLSKYFPPITYYVEDIDTASCNKRTFQKTIKLFNPTFPIDNIIFTYGTTTATNLPKNKFTKVLMIAVVHEFDEKEKMFADIKSILQPGGFIFIEEPLVITPGRKDKGCNNPYLTATQLAKIIADNGLTIVEEKYTSLVTGNAYRKIYKCKVQ